MQTRKWQDQQGQDRYTTEIIADQMQMLGGRGDGAGQGQGGGYQQRPQSPNAGSQHGGGQNQGGYQQQPNANQRPAQNQGNQPPPMAEPDFDFDDDIPF